MAQKNNSSVSPEQIAAAVGRVEARVRERLPEAEDLHATAEAVRHAAELAGQRIRAMNNPFSIPRLRLYFTLLGCSKGSSTSP